MGNGGISRRKFLAITGAAGSAMLLASRATLAAGGGGLSVAIVVDGSDQATKGASVQWAVGRLAEALKERGVTVKPDGDVKILVGDGRQGIDRAFIREGVSLAAEAGGVRIFSGDARGLVYGITELADRVQYAGDPRGALTFKTPLNEKPATPIRGMFRMFASEKEDKGWFYDRDNWQRYFDFLVTQRFNRFNLSFGLTYDFSRNVTDAYTFFAYPFFVNVPGYSVQAIARGGTPLAQDEQRKNLDTLKFITDQAALRGLDFNLGLWTHSYQWTNSPTANYTIAGLDAKTQAPYSRDAMHLMLSTCPGITGVTLRTHGESGIPEGSYDLWKIIMSGTTGFKNADGSPRPIEIDLHGKTMTDEMIDTALSTGMPVTISCKFAAEHCGLPYVQASIREQEMPKGRDAGGLMALSSGSRSFLRYGIGDLLRKGRKYKVIHRIWPGTQKVLLAGDPVYLAQMGKAASFAGMDGIEYFEPLSFRGRAGSSINTPLAPDRSGYTDASGLRVLKEEGGEMFKYAYQLRLQGRLAYNPAAAAETWERAQPGKPLRDALAAASRILPLITSAHLPCAACGLYWPETYTNQSLYDPAHNPYSEAPSPKIFANVTALDPQIFSSVSQFADDFSQGKIHARITPLHVAAQLRQWGDSAVDALAKWSPSASAADRRLAIDVGIAAGVGRFFAHKLVAATLYATYIRTGYDPALAAAKDYYGKALAQWEDLVKTSNVYIDDLTYGIDRQVRRNWADRLADIKADLERLPATPNANHAANFSKESIDALIANPWPSVQKLVSLKHDSPGTFRPGTAIRLALAGTENYGGRLLYRHVHQGQRYQAAPLEKDDASLAASIPAEYTQSAFPLAYYFELSNDKNAFLHPGFGPDFVGQPYYLLTQPA